MLTSLLSLGLVAVASAAEYSLVVQPFDNSSMSYKSVLSHDGRLAATGGYDRTVRLWHVPTSRVLRVIRGHNRDIADLAFSPDDKTVYSMNDGGVVRWHEVATGAEQGWLSTIGSSLTSKSFALTADGTMLASADYGALKLWKLSTKELLRTLAVRDPTKTYVPGRMRFTPDSKYLISTSEYEYVVHDVASGAIVCSAQNDNRSLDLAVSPDGKSAQAGLKSFDPATCAARQDIPDRRWDFAATLHGSQADLIAPKLSPVYGLRFIPGSHALTFSSGINRTLILDLESGLGLRQGPPVMFPAWHPGGKVVAGVHYRPPEGKGPRMVQQRDAASGLLIREHELLDAAGKPLDTQSVALSNDGTTIAACGGTDLGFYDSSSGKLLRGRPGLSNSLGCSLRFSNDDKRLLVLAGGPEKYGSSFHLIEVATGADVDLEMIKPMADLALHVSSDGRYAAWDTSNTVYVRDLQSKTTRAFPRSDDRRGYAFSPDGKTLVIGTNTGRIEFFDLATGEPGKTVAGNEGFFDLSYSDDGRYLAGYGWSNVVMLWNLITDQRVLFSVSEDNWIAYTRDGYFDGSRDGGRLVVMVKEAVPYAVDQFAAARNRPDLILSRVGLGSAQLIEHYQQQYRKRLKRLGLSEEKLSLDLAAPDAAVGEAVTEGKFVSLKFSCSDNKGEIEHYNLFVNDVPLHGARGAAVAPAHALTQQAKVELTHGQNKIEVSCRNGAGAESYRALTVANYQPEPPRDLYYLGFGVSQYKRTELNLMFAHKDAQDLAALFNKPRPGFAATHVKAYLNEQVTAASIAKAKALLSTAKADDVFVLFIAGHGVHDTDAEATYYYLTHEADPAALARTAVNFDTIEDLLQGIAPRTKLFLMDTCESGESDGTAAAAVNVPGALSRGIRKSAQAGPAAAAAPRPYLQARERYIYNDLVRRSGAVVFSSSRGGELSYEDAELSNGYFTAEIVKALSSPIADRDQDHVVSFDELRAFVASAVSERSHGLQNPTVDRDNLSQRISFPLPAVEPAPPVATPSRKSKKRNNKKKSP